MEPIQLTWDEKSNTKWQTIALNVAVPIIAVLLLGISIKRPLFDFRVLPLLIGGVVAFFSIKAMSNYHIRHEFVGGYSGFKYTVMDISKVKEPQIKPVTGIKYGIFKRQIDCAVDIPFNEVLSYEMIANKSCLRVHCEAGHLVDIRLKGLKENEIIEIQRYLKTMTDKSY